MKKFARNLVIYLVIFGIVMGVAYFVRNGGGSQQEVALSTMAKYLKNGKVTEVTIKDSKVTAQIGKNKSVYAYANSALELEWLEEKYIYNKVDSGDIVLRASGPDHASALMNALPTIIMVVALGFLFYIMMNQGGNGKAFQFGKNRAHMYKGEGKKITFADVAGLKEEKEELQEVVDFLKDPRKYNSVGARIPKGILLVGPPGTGKTYVSRATAGEAGVPFFTISGSDFVEMFVGVGASRVRDLFEQAKKNAPCIIFIDEIDAVGRKRGAGLGGGNDEREQTLNQLLVEMDGFAGNSGIIILAATNRPDILDPALLRPGRFDRQITIGVPDVKGREEIIRIHAKNKPLSDEVSPEIIARRTPGFTPADLENLLNEAALITARRNGRWIRMAEIEEATTKVMAGPAKKSRVISEKEKRLTAYHEAGHAVVMRSIPGSDPVHQITIIPRGQAGGFTMSLPTEDKYFMTKKDMMHEIMHLLGGRVAEAIYLDDISTGASNDIERATQIARSMVTKYGFSDKLGPINYSDSDEPFLGRDFSKTKAYSEEVANEIDEEVRRLVGDAYAKTEALLKEHSAEMERVAQALIRVETLDAEQFEDLYTGKEDAESTERKVREHEAEIQRVNKAEAEESRRIRKAEDERAEEMRDALLNGQDLSDDQVRHIVADENGHVINPYAEKDQTDKDSEQDASENGIQGTVSDQNTNSKKSNAAAEKQQNSDSQDDNGGIDEE